MRALNINAWKDKDDNLYVIKAPDGIDVEFIPAGTNIDIDCKHLSRKIRDLKIIHGPSCLPPLERNGDNWKWQGFAARGNVKHST